MVVKEKPILPHMDASLDHHAHSSSYEAQLHESVHVSSISSLSACQQPTGRAEMHCCPGHSLCITFPSALPWLDVVSSSLFFLPDWVEESRRLQQGQLEHYWCRSWALVQDHWTYHLLHASSQLQTHMYKMHLNTKWVNARILYTKHNTHCFSSIFLLFERSKVGRLFDFIDFTCRCTYYSFTLASHLQTSD